MLIKIDLAWPRSRGLGFEDGAVHEGEDVAGHVAIDSHTVGNQHLVTFTDAHLLLIEGPVAQAEQAQAVGR